MNLPSPNTMRFRRPPQNLFNYFYSYLFCLDNVFALGILTCSIIALLAHKITIILLHGPLSTLSVIFFGPFLFVFDIITILLQHRGLASVNRSWQILAGFIGIVIISCSATFVSLYLEANAEVNWGRSVEIASNWKIYSKLMAQGSGNFGKVFMIYLAFGAAAMLARRMVEARQGQPDLLLSEKVEFSELSGGQGAFRRFIREPFVTLTIFLLFGAMLLPCQPWKHMTATLLYDVVGTVSSAIITKSLRDVRGDCSKSTVGGNPFGVMNYNPSDDPYYISNLDSPLDPFIAKALHGTQFTNIVHIVLESMRDDSYPWKEDGLLAQYIESKYDKVEGGPEMSTSNITPFIESLAEHTISWETVWATIPFTHKAMLGHYCGQLALPIDFSVEFEDPARMYQHCLPQVFRYMNSVTNTESEILALHNNTRPRTTDMWETVHIETATGVYDHEKDILQGVGFNTVITAEELGQVADLGEFDTPLGYFDERGLEHFWKYVDNTMNRVPKNRMYLGWMSTTTHTPFRIPSEWKGRKNYVWDHGEWDSVDNWMNAVRWTDDKVKEIILGFRERGLENETLFLIHGDHGFPFAGQWSTPIENPHNEAYRIPLMIYNPNIQNPTKQKVQGNFYTLSLPTTILDLMIETNSFAQSAQKYLARNFAQNYEFAQSLLRPIKDAIRFFFVHPGGTQWVLDNSRNLRIKFNMNDNHVHLIDYVADPLELDGLDSWNGVEGLISGGADEKFGAGTAEFLREAFLKQEFMKTEILRRYGLQD